MSQPSASLMHSLLQHIVGMTCHRDRGLLNVSVATALHELLQASQVRVLDIVQFHAQHFLRPLVEMHDGKAIVADDCLEIEQPRELAIHYPALARCILQRVETAQEQQADGSFVLWRPVWINDKLNVCIEVTRSDAFDAVALQVLEGIISVYRNFHGLIDYSERDSLTGLLNRKTFDENFTRMIATQTHHDGLLPQTNPERRALTDHKGQWLGVVDIDHFKRVNDQFGHLYGDEVLLLVSNLLQQSFRSHDRIFRFGGEEFVILLRSATRDDAKKIFARFRTNVEKHHFPQIGQVTVSVGFAGIGDETPVTILGHADQALYYAKTHGRNQVCHYDELVQSGELASPHAANDSIEFFN